MYRKTKHPILTMTKMAENYQSALAFSLPRVIFSDSIDLTTHTYLLKHKVILKKTRDRTTCS